ncbi:MAG: methionyl-tRNA formyltransferase [Gammaproteobacteria bacterium]|nr:methionyl-tRNA formyltransferase [Gammaproteobacteria bacterium]MBM4209146.1 methionyl-tRNA formyltransferase [Gammaproteobacteria bacterium]MBM4223414.1 methionyl-tRNA formyltransferase [Gammaproteobacteria bacterium]
MRIVFAGTPEFAVPPLAALNSSRHHLVGVLTQPDRPAGRGRRLAASAVKEFAVAQGLTVAQPATLRTAEGRAALAAWQPDVLVVVAYGLILPPEALAVPRLGCINIHASLLPRWRGAAPVQRAILAGDALTGVTLMQMDAGLDTGPILLQRELPISLTDDTRNLLAALAALGAPALLEVLDGLEAGTVVPRPQPTLGVSHAAKIDKAEARIDWRESALAIDRRIRAFRPWPIAETTYHGEQVRIHRASVIAQGASARQVDSAAPGTILGLRDDLLLVSCGKDFLGIAELQRAGRRSMSAREFANGLRATGEVFE